MMLIQRLYVKEFFKVLLTITAGLALVFSILGLIDKIDDFMPHRPAARLLIEYTLLSIPRYVHYLFPMAILLSSLFIFAQAIKRKEIVAIKASGGKMKRILMPFVAIGIILTLFGFVLAEIIVPVTAKRTHSIKNQITEKGKEFAFKEGTIYMRGKDGSIVRVGLFLPDRNISQTVTIFKFDENGLHERIDAVTALWENKQWKLKDVTIYNMGNGTISSRPEMIHTGIESPKIFQEDVWKIEELTMLELIKYRDRLSAAGFKNIKLTVDISSRLSYPLVNLFMLLLGISLSIGEAPQRFLWNVSSSNSVVAAGLGLLISLLYWLGYSFFLSLGYAGALHPIIAPWVIPAIFAVISTYLYRQIPE